MLEKKRLAMKKMLDEGDSAVSLLSNLGDAQTKKRMRKSETGHHLKGHDDLGDLDDIEGFLANKGLLTKPKFSFSEADDRKIIEAYNNYTAVENDHLHAEGGLLKKWQYVAEYLNNGATAHQVGRRWREKLDPALSALKSGTFTPEEDEKLLRLIEEHSSDGRGGGKNWTAICSKMNRKAKECEHRGATLMAKHLKQGAFTLDEDELLIKLHNEGKTFNEIGRILSRKPKSCANRLESTTELYK